MHSQAIPLQVMKVYKVPKRAKGSNSKKGTSRQFVYVKKAYLHKI